MELNKMEVDLRKSTIAKMNNSEYGYVNEPGSDEISGRREILTNCI